MPRRESNRRALNDRRKDAEGEIRHAHSSAIVGTLRQTYGDSFAAGYRSDTKLGTLLERSGAASLSDLLRNRGDARISDSSRAILDRTTVKYRTVLKRLANQ